jgi:SnoaL-like domain
MERRAVLTLMALGAAGFRSSLLFLPGALAVEGINERREGMSNINEIVVRYLAAWNERDAKRRRELVTKTWAEDGSYVDHVRDGVGHDRIDAMIATAQEHFPGYRVGLASGIEAHHDYVRFSWVAGGTPDAPLYLKGTDFAVVTADGRLKSVIGFTDAAPANAP